VPFNGGGFFRFDYLKREAHAGQAAERRAQNLVSLDHGVQRRLQFLTLEFSFHEKGALRLVSALVHLLQQPDALLLK
jgi:hypothetical protein